MTKPTCIVGFVANEDSRVHLAQLADTSRDAGLDSFEGKKIKALLINRTIFSGEVTRIVLTVNHLLSLSFPDDCN